MDDITKNPEYNKFREVCRSIQQAGEDCLEELIRMDKSSRTEVDKLYTSLGIGYEPCLNTRKDYLWTWLEKRKAIKVEINDRYSFISCNS